MCLEIIKVHQKKKKDQQFQCDECEYKYSKRDTQEIGRDWRKFKDKRNMIDAASIYVPKRVLWKRTYLEITKNWRKRRLNATHVFECTKKDTLRMHKGVQHKAKLSNCDNCDYSCTKNKMPVMHKFRKHGGHEPPMKLCELCEFTCLTTGGPRFHQNAEHSGLEGP